MSSSSVPISSGSREKKRAVSSDEAGAKTKDGGATDDGPPKHKRMRLEDINGQPSADPHGDLDLALQRRAQVLTDLEAARERHRRLEDTAKRRLQECTTNEEAARQDIRARGETVFDSLLVVGKDSVSHIFDYFDVKQLCQCERTCKAFQKLSAEAWKDLDKRTGPNKSTFTDSPKERCVRYARASEYAVRMESLAEDHNLGHYEDLHTDIVLFRRDAGTNAIETSDLSDSGIYPYCERLRQDMMQNGFNVQCSCEFPEQMSDAIIPHKEVFLRISGETEGSVLFEGFCPLDESRWDSYCPFVDFRGFSHSKWPLMERLLKARKKKGALSKTRIKKTLESIGSVTMVALSIPRNEPQLLIANKERFRYVERADKRSDFVERDDMDKRKSSWCAGITAPLFPHNEIREKSRVPFVEVQFVIKSDGEEDIVGFRILREHINMDETAV